MMFNVVYEKYCKILSQIKSLKDELDILLPFKYSLVKDEKNKITIACDNVHSIYNFLTDTKCYSVSLEGKSNVIITYKSSTVDNINIRKNIIAKKILEMFNNEMKALANKNKIFSNNSKMSDEEKSQQKKVAKEYENFVSKFILLTKNFKIR